MVQAEIKYLLGNNGDRIPYIVANASAIAMGDFVQLTDNMIVITHDGSADVPIVGIAAHEKVASDGHTSISVITNCVYKATVVGGGTTCVFGQEVSMGAAAGEVELYDTLDHEVGKSVGFALQTSAAGETIFIRMVK